MQELLQKDGRNWRRFAFLEDCIHVQEEYQGDQHSYRYHYDKLGPLKPDYEYNRIREYRFSTRWRLGLFFGASLVSITCILISSVLSGPGETPTTGADIMAALFFIIFILGFVLLFLGKQTRLKVIFFSDNTMFRLYARNSKDEDQIASFEESYEKARLAHLKRFFMTEAEKEPSNLGDLLAYLNENDQFTPDEYREYLRMITGTSKKRTAKSGKK